MPAIFGWGGVLIGNQEFTTSFGTLSYEKVDVRNVTIDGKIIVHSKGWRPIIDVELFNTGSDGHWNFIGLADAISQSQAYGETIAVYPRYTSTDLGSVLYYNCLVDSDFAPEDIANVNVGQSIKLRFIGQDLVNRMATNYSGQTESDFVDENTNKIVDDTGNQIILF